ncbi:uncharacterized protein EV420DRAFT_1744839 [Desarmillaria tabescens]|uniref:Uncharacterized protein n=1 Tax=Armillaria tabescens TaxID=1929756 RepID=A0AA39NF24_ARMTA|nr:uncharacterized protein EV420DRAFT_1744839 [Desarmillaria tabescens]KAK0464467.1 hypothetical protein EV420DRAFT_1744839 [Desarmillaria tabescens]
MAPYRSLMETELLPMLYTDPAGLSSSIITKRQADLLDTVSDDKKKDWEFTASTDSSLSNDMLCALDDDLSNNPAFSQLYLEYGADIRKVYEKRLSNSDDNGDEHHNTYCEAVVDRFAGSIVDCVRDTTMRLLPDCSPFHATLKPYSISPTLVVVPDYTLFFRDRSTSLPVGVAFFLGKTRAHSYCFLPPLLGQLVDPYQQAIPPIGNVGLQRVGRLFPQPDGGYQPYVHLHDMFLASSIITALASNSDYATDFPSLERFRNQRRPQPAARKSDLYDVHGRKHDMPLYSSQSSESDGLTHDPTYNLSQDSPATSASLSPGTRALSRATSIFNVLHGCGGVSMLANFYWRVQMRRRHSSCDIDIESSLGSSSDGDTYLVGVRGSNKKLVLKVFSFTAFGQAEFCAYMAYEGFTR